METRTERRRNDADMLAFERRSRVQNERPEVLEALGWQAATRQDWERDYCEWFEREVMPEVSGGR